jgi:hypothetical protein
MVQNTVGKNKAIYIIQPQSVPDDTLVEFAAVGAISPTPTNHPGLMRGGYPAEMRLA